VPCYYGFPAELSTREKKQILTVIGFYMAMILNLVWDVEEVPLPVISVIIKF
jgi:hypothetical protein